MTELVEVRAVVRLEMLERVVRSLKESGIPRLTVSRVHAIGAGVDPASTSLSLDEGSEYTDKALVQFICGAADAERVTALVAAAARTGRRGDGIVAVHPVLAVTKVRTGATSLRALT